MDEAIQQAIREITKDPFITDGQRREILRRLLELRTLLTDQPLDAERIRRALVILGAYARLAHVGVGRWIWVVIRGTGAIAAAGEAGGAGAGAGAATGGAAGGWIVVPIAVIAASVGWIAWNLWRRSHGPDDLGPSGKPCGQDSSTGLAMATTKRTAVAKTLLGAMVSWDWALENAQNDCARLAANCRGECADGGTCKPNVAILDWEQHFEWAPPGKVTTLTYACPCECL